jgi:hypothetical protein
MGVDPNWGLSGGNNALAMFQQGVNMGNAVFQRKDEADYRKQQLAHQQKQEERQGAEFAASQEERAGKAKKEQQGQIATMAKLLGHAKDEPTYQQSLSAARQLGMNVDSAPANFDPDWVGQQQMIVAAFQQDGGQRISGIAQELKDAGVDLNSSEGQQLMRQRIAARDSKPFNVGPGEGRYDIDPATGQPRTIIAPYGAPAAAGGAIPPPPPGFTLDTPGGGAGNNPVGFPG